MANAGLLMKIIETVLVALCAMLRFHNSYSDGNNLWIVVVAIWSYVIIMSGYIVGILTQQMPKMVDKFFTLVGAVLFLVAGTSMFHWSHERSYGSSDLLLHGLVLIAAGIAFIVDLVMGIMRE